MAEGVVQLTDPRALRAVAHPTRLKLMAVLRRLGPLTATQAGRRIEESPSGCSFHLRQLAKWGLVEEAGGGRGRERPWRATSTGTEWPAHGASAEVDEAGEMLSRVVVQRWFEEATEWLTRRHQDSREWTEAAVLEDRILYLSAAEMVDVQGQIGALLEPYMRRLPTPEAGPPDARAVTFIQLGFPIPEDAAAD